MKNWIIKLFLDNWIRKLISLILAIITWFVVDQSLTTTKTVSTVGVRVLNIPEGKTIAGLQSSGLLNKRISLTLTGKKSYLEDLASSDIEIALDASGMRDEFVANIYKKHLVSLNPELSVSHHINKIAPINLIIKMVPLAEEKIPIYITQPIGEPPKGFQFLDVWPYHLDLTVKGPEDIIKRLKNQGIKLTFNLNDIHPSQLERSNPNTKQDVVSYFIPNEWKFINIPSLSEKPIEIDDQDSKHLRIDFIRSDVIPLNFAIPINVFVSPNHRSNINPNAFHLNNNDLISMNHGIKVLNEQLYVKGVSKIFVKTIRDMLSLSINLMHSSASGSIDWSMQFINPTLLENRYISAMMADPGEDDSKDMHPRLRQEYLRNRFRNYMNRFQLFTEDETPFDLKVDMKGKEIHIQKQDTILTHS